MTTRKSLKTYCVKIKLKPNSLQKVSEWSKELNSREEEVFETLRDEGVYLETVFLETTKEADYLIYVMKLEDEERAAQVVKTSKHKIDAFHKKFKADCWESRTPLKLLVDFDRSSER